MITDADLKRFRVPPKKKIALKDYDPAWTGIGPDEPDPKKRVRKQMAEELLAKDVADLAEAQELLYASDTWSILMILQAMDAAGKDGVIKHVTRGLNPLGCQAYSFKQPSAEELDHTYLWRCMKALPERGRVGIFNRSYDEEVLVVRVHPTLIENQRIPGAKAGARLWRQRYDEINHFERHLSQNGTLVLKFFLYVSPQEQAKRFRARMDDPTKHWKFSSDDLRDRGYWDEYMKAYEDVLNATSTPWAPWYIIPADHKWISRTLVARILVEGIRGLDLQYPTVTEEKRRAIAEARAFLEKES